MTQTQILLVSSVLVLLASAVVYLILTLQKLKKKQEAFKGWRVDKINGSYHFINDDNLSILESSGKKI